MSKNKKIFVEYLTIDNEIYENNKMRIALNAPKYDKYKELFLYELFYHDFLQDKIKNTLSKNFNEYQFYDSFLIELTSEQFNEIKYLFNNESDLEKEKWADSYSLFKVLRDVYKLNPKFWET